MNGMVVNRGDIASVNVRHTGDVMNKVIEGTYTVLQTAETALEAPDKWSRIQLASPERMALAEAAHSLRFADNEGNVTTPVKPEQLLMTRRTDDEGHDLWSTFNVIQENVIRGGLHAVGHNANNQVIRRTSRAVKGIDQNVKLNRALWQLGEKMAELKAA